MFSPLFNSFTLRSKIYYTGLHTRYVTHCHLSSRLHRCPILPSFLIPDAAYYKYIYPYSLSGLGRVTIVSPSSSGMIGRTPIGGDLRREMLNLPGISLYISLEHMVIMPRVGFRRPSV